MFARSQSGKNTYKVLHFSELLFRNLEILIASISEESESIGDFKKIRF